MPGPTHQVANPPSKTLLVYDGDCGFCKLWIARWREITAGAVDYEELQDAAVRFPEVPRAAFENAVKLIETDGRVFSGAEAVYRSLGKGGGSGFWRWAFEHVPGFALISNYAYAFIARHRTLAHTVTSLFWGKDVRRPTYFQARRWFLRFLGLIYLIAFLSLWVQVDGLIGARGLAPAPQLLTAAHAQLGGQAYLALPTLCWLRATPSCIFSAAPARFSLCSSLPASRPFSASSCFSHHIFRSASWGRRSSAFNGISCCSKRDSLPSSSRPGAGGRSAASLRRYHAPRFSSSIFFSLN